MPKVITQSDHKSYKKKNSGKWKWPARIVLGLLGLLLVGVLLIFGTIGWDIAFGKEAKDFTNTTYESADGTKLAGYLAKPKEGTRHPAVLMFHEWWGVTEDITKVADALAAEGYIVFVPDLFRNQSTQMVQRALWMAMRRDQNQISADVDASLQYLTKEVEGVDTGKIGTVGFCFGGQQSLLTAIRQSDQLAAMAMFYGTPVTDKAELGKIQTKLPVLGLWGEEDAMISRNDVEKMGKMMTELGISNEQIFYTGMDHAFLNSENYNKPGEPQKAWAELLAFLDKHLVRR